MTGKIPKHVSIIMDGNGRWAKSRGLKRLEGHKAGVESVRAVTELAVEKGVKYLSLFAFSEENWSRPKNEVLGLMELMINAMINEKATLMKNGVRFLVIGDKSRLGDSLNAKIKEIEELTFVNKTLTLVIFLSYSGKWDIVQAANSYLERIRSGETCLDQQLTVDVFNSLLSTASIPDPDLLIRTSGEQRISNYMLWQCAYSEFYFTETLWPDFRKIDFEKALETYANRERRYGKTGDQINKIN